MSEIELKRRKQDSCPMPRLWQDRLLSELLLPGQVRGQKNHRGCHGPCLHLLWRGWHFPQVGLDNFCWICLYWIPFCCFYFNSIFTSVHFSSFYDLYFTQGEGLPSHADSRDRQGLLRSTALPRWVWRNWRGTQVRLFHSKHSTMTVMMYEWWWWWLYYSNLWHYDEVISFLLTTSVCVHSCL